MIVILLQILVAVRFLLFVFLQIYYCYQIPIDTYFLLFQQLINLMEKISSYFVYPFLSFLIFNLNFIFMSAGDG